MLYENQLKILGMFNLEKSKFGGSVIVVIKYLEGYHGKKVTFFFALKGPFEQNTL